MKKRREPPGLSQGLQELLCAMAGLPKDPPRNSRTVHDLAGAVKRLSDGYIMPGQSQWESLYANKLNVSAYLLYYLPVNLVKLFPLLEELSRTGAFDLLQRRSISALDIGCGPGTFMLGILEYIAAHYREGSPLASIQLTGIDQSQENLRTAQKLLEQYRGTGGFPTPIQFTASVHQTAVMQTAFPADQYDLIIGGNVLCELPEDHAAACIEKAVSCLAPGGAFIIVEPGTRQASRRLLHLRTMLLNTGELQLAGPCLHAAPCPLESDEQAWCHEKLFWQPTAAVSMIDGLLGFSKHKGIKFSYMTFVRTGLMPPAVSSTPPAANHWRVVSYLISTKGQSRLWVCSGREHVELRLLDRNVTDGNSDFKDARRGDVVCVEGAIQKAQFYDIPRQALVRIVTWHNEP